MMRAAALQGTPVRTEDGRRLGRVREIHVRGGEVIALTCGGGGFLQRFLPSRRGHRIDWGKVRHVGGEAIIVAGRQDARRNNGKSGSGRRA